ncbi:MULTISPECIES: Txe/YoeB family addiction module toxin [Gammaproteobacteria]|uniref:Toxin YoeB n=4 Tax=Psychrobacter TaxID=497 RepID=A0A1G6ZZJ9_9GAMM|nr:MULTISPECIES: Txe/YoeB family addiction module toxin [Psychrobacter]MAG54150.1 Txe/YoeB family addiction module toxin [Halomonas sp.]MED6317774.1 Txe/YoeB family addiction module toxin [Pseudomonadota bacterium]MCG3858519.1 Txe/YoeB family addiction module toxin [Psychrobacter sp. Ps2]MDE0843529.1 Txe/YoeB family addiction module toxin [Psychrobacter pacificensis]MDH4905979.1 Txe/YoeB family addiction module toxin [Psychrobacter pocilloporae]
MILSWTQDAWEDYEYWQKTSKEKVKQISKLIKAIKRDPFEGIGKPEPLKHDLAGYWSRRIDQEHRLVYEVQDDAIIIVQCRYHY